VRPNEAEPVISAVKVRPNEAESVYFSC
jgi:hypothetical protein